MGWEGQVKGAGKREQAGNQGKWVKAYGKAGKRQRGERKRGIPPNDEPGQCAVKNKIYIVYKR